MARAGKAEYGGLLVVIFGVIGLFGQCDLRDVSSGGSSVPSSLLSTTGTLDRASTSKNPPSRYDISKSNTSILRVVLADSLNCRSAPATTADIMTRIAHGMVVAVAKEEDGWSLLQSPACWVSSSYLGDSPRATRPPLAAEPSSKGVPLRSYTGGACPCSGPSVCIGPRGGRYCITSGGNKRYGV